MIMEELTGSRKWDEYRIKLVEEVKYMKNRAEKEQKIAATGTKKTWGKVPVQM